MFNDIKSAFEIVSLYARAAASENDASTRECNDAVRRVRVFIENTLKPKEVAA